jgi:hypothetical protein
MECYQRTSFRDRRGIPPPIRRRLELNDSRGEINLPDIRDEEVRRRFVAQVRSALAEGIERGEPL